MVFNVTADDVRVRMSAVDEDIWPVPAVREKGPPNTEDAIPMTEFTLGGREMMPDVLGPIWDEINRLYGTDFRPTGGQ
jgi:hypothetical protein